MTGPDGEPGHNEDARFLPACQAADVGDGRYAECEVAALSLLICRSGGRLSAIENRCSHLGKPLAGGRMIGQRIVCPAHGAAFDITTGKPLSFPAVLPIRIFPLAERDGQVLVSIEES